MTNLSGHQFGQQESLLHDTNPALRPPTHAQMSPEQFRDAPGALHHGTYRHNMPERIVAPMSAGVHLGTLDAAKDRIDHMGPRNIHMIPPRAGIDSHEDFEFKPADIHVRRLADDVDRVPDHTNPKHYAVDRDGKYMKGNAQYPEHDQGEDWKHGFEGEDRGSEHFGEFYRNDAEDIGSISVRVPNSSYLTSHRQAADSAIREGKSVHPRVEGLMRDFGGRGVDEPIKYTSGERSRSAQDVMMSADTPWAHQQRMRGRTNNENVQHESLLPYKVVGNREASNPAYEHVTDPVSGDRTKQPAITFAATSKEAREMTERPEVPNVYAGRRTVSVVEGRNIRRGMSSTMPSPEVPRWKKAYWQDSDHFDNM